MDLSIITVTWNAEEKIADQLRSAISACKHISVEQIVIDNASKDSTREIIEKEFPEITLIKNETNAGFGGPNNQGVKVAKGRYLLFLNPDMRLEGSLDKMVAWMDAHTDVGLASCKLVMQDGKFNHEAAPRRFPGVLDQLALLLKIPHVFPSVLDHYLMKDFDSEKEQEVDTVRGAFFFMRRDVTDKLGWAFDPRYYFWFEDVDTCREVWKLDYKVMYTPVVSCVDYVGQSFKKRTSLWKQKQFTKSMVQYFQKWEPSYKWVWLWLFRPFAVGATWIKDKL